MYNCADIQLQLRCSEQKIRGMSFFQLLSPQSLLFRTCFDMLKTREHFGSIDSEKSDENMRNSGFKREYLKQDEVCRAIFMNPLHTFLLNFGAEVRREISLYGHSLINFLLSKMWLRN